MLENNSKYEIYNKYIGQYAIVTNINYNKKDNIVGLKFLNGENIDFKPCELRKCDYIEEMQNKGNYKELLKTI